jgi:hypothetical protein
MRTNLEVRYVEQTPLDVCLELWLRWLDRSDTCVGWRGRSAGIVGEAEASSEQLYDRMDNETGAAMDTMISDLKVQHNWAIKKRCGVAILWRFPSLVFADVLADAEKELERKMKNNIATRNYFN